MIRIADQPADAATAPPPSEFPFATQDGRVWPFARHQMNDSRAIVARMAEDILSIERISGFVAKDDLIDRGWKSSQIFEWERASVTLALRCRATGADPTQSQDALDADDAPGLKNIGAMPAAPQPDIAAAAPPEIICILTTARCERSTRRIYFERVKRDEDTELAAIRSPIKWVGAMLELEQPLIGVEHWTARAQHCTAPIVINPAHIVSARLATWREIDNFLHPKSREEKRALADAETAAAEEALS